MKSTLWLVILLALLVLLISACGTADQVTVTKIDALTITVVDFRGNEFTIIRRVVDPGVVVGDCIRYDTLAAKYVRCGS